MNESLSAGVSSVPEVTSALEVSELPAPGSTRSDSPTCVRAVFARIPQKNPARDCQRAACRYLVGELLSTMASGAPGAEKWALQKEASGAPRLSCDGQPSRLQVSMAHSGRWVAAAVGHNARVGVDIERERSLGNVEAMAEYMGWRAQVSSAGDFFRLWTLWEAFVKAEQSSIFSKRHYAFVALAAQDNSDPLKSSGCWSAVHGLHSDACRFALVIRQQAVHPLQLRNFN